MLLRRICVLVCLTPPIEVWAFLPCNNERITRTYWPLNGVASACDVAAPLSCIRSDCNEQRSGPTAVARKGQSSTPTPGQLCKSSFERWIQLPESWASSKKKKIAGQSQSWIVFDPRSQSSTNITKSHNSKEAYQKYIQSLSIDHPIRLGVTRKQRSTELIHAAELGNSTRLELLLQAGANVDVMDLYRITSLHYAAANGHLEAVRVLLKWGANVGDGDDVNSSPIRAAFANGHAEIVALLTISHSTSDVTSSAATTILEQGEPPISQPQHQQHHAMMIRYSVIPLKSNHLGAGSFYIDNAFHDEFLDKLANLHDSIRSTIIGQHHNSNNTSSHQKPQSTNAARRSHYCDTEGWLCAALTSALQHAEQSQSSQTIKQEFPQNIFPHVRFISYLGENSTTSFLAPHKDFPVLDRSNGRTSTHTFILYLTTVAQGGETVLLDYLPSAKNNSYENNDMIENSMYAVKPVRGRLFCFPHGCPHAGRHVVDGSKLILRGDVN